MAEVVTTLEQRLRRAIEAHIEDEMRWIEKYQAMLADLLDDEVGLLIQMILEDELRHHRLFQKLAEGLNGPTGTRTQSMRAPAAEVASRLSYAAVEERVGAQELLALAREGRDAQGGFFSLLLEVIASDSQTHALVLAYAAQRLRSSVGELESREPRPATLARKGPPYRSENP